VAADLYDHADDWREDDDQEPDDDWYDDDPPERDPEDGDIARAYEEHYEHLDAVHGGGECDCRPSLAARASQALRGAGYWLAGPWWRLKAAMRHPWTLRAGPAEITLRLRADHRCGACGGRGWNYSLTPKPEHPIPPGYNGAALCGCGSVIGKLAETRRYLRSTRNDPPF
jgi:hypothetical protein